MHESESEFGWRTRRRSTRRERQNLAYYIMNYGVLFTHCHLLAQIMSIRLLSHPWPISWSARFRGQDSGIGGKERIAAINFIDSSTPFCFHHHRSPQRRLLFADLPSSSSFSYPFTSSTLNRLINHPQHLVRHRRAPLLALLTNRPSICLSCFAFSVFSQRAVIGSFVRLLLPTVLYYSPLSTFRSRQVLPPASGTAFLTAASCSHAPPYSWVFCWRCRSSRSACSSAPWSTPIV